MWMSLGYRNADLEKRIYIQFLPQWYGRVVARHVYRGLEDSTFQETKLRDVNNGLATYFSPSFMDITNVSNDVEMPSTHPESIEGRSSTIRIQYVLSNSTSRVVLLYQDQHFFKL